MSPVVQFMNDFIIASVTQRAELILNVSYANTHVPQIYSMIRKLNVNTVAIDYHNRGDSIHFVCQQLMEYSDFVYP